MSVRAEASVHHMSQRGRRPKNVAPYVPSRHRPTDARPAQLPSGISKNGLGKQKVVSERSAEKTKTSSWSSRKPRSGCRVTWSCTVLSSRASRGRSPATLTGRVQSGRLHRCSFISCPVVSSSGAVHVRGEG